MSEQEKPESHVRTAELAKKSEATEKKRQKERARERKIHLQRSSKPDAQQQIHAALPEHR